jgi:hypothetical protein
VAELVLIIMQCVEEQQLNLHNQEILEHLLLEIQVEQVDLQDQVDQAEEVVEQVLQDLKVLDQVVLEELVEQEKIHLQ